MTHPLERDAGNDAALLAEIAARIPQVLANLDDNMPGFPVRNSDNVTTITTRDIRSPVEAMVLAPPDTALRDAARQRELARTIHNAVREWFDLTSRWAFQSTTKHTHSKLARTTAEDWCSSCLRIPVCSPRHRGDLCKWCYEFKLARGSLPAVHLLDAHHRGIRITEDMITGSKR